MQRDDDREETVRKRLTVYNDQTKPLIDFYQGLSQRNPAVRYHRIDGMSSVDSVKAAILAALA